MFSSGAGVEVVENAGHLTARVYLPWTFIVSVEWDHSIPLNIRLTDVHFHL